MHLHRCDTCSVIIHKNNNTTATIHVIGFVLFFSFQKVPSIKDFSIIKIISRGAFGQVFLGYKNTDESKLFAIKVSCLSYSWMYD